MSAEGLGQDIAQRLGVLEEVNFDSLPTRVIVLTAAEDWVRAAWCSSNPPATCW